MNNEELIVNQFGQNAAKYVMSKIHADGKDLRSLIEFVQGEKNERLLDIATGGGHVANALAHLFQDIVAFDLTENMLKKAEQFIRSNGHSNVSFVQGNAEKLPFPNESFDTITCRIAAHHFTNVKQFVAEVQRTLEREGFFFLVDNVAPELEEYDDFYNFVEKKRDPSHYRAYKKTEWISLLEHNGLQVQSYITFDKEFNFDWWCEMMDVPKNVRDELTSFMINAPKEMQEWFHITIENNEVKSFNTEVALFVVRKTSTLKR
ncbi:class I SAM-dependent methyltransferase [Bacillus sp. UNC322MFChir4.1]|uniref:class I SAM-dependent methyltransferase n=1 Tax=Bacillus sp. UNC322MFChir4.1 TaxID=1449045 RepID=UPI0005521ACC|nr:class I SAM-dependent methyltransferase [Bacillus sp. UNC322MFChir4.1]